MSDADRAAAMEIIEHLQANEYIEGEIIEAILARHRDERRDANLGCVASTGTACSCWHCQRERIAELERENERLRAQHLADCEWAAKYKRENERLRATLDEWINGAAAMRGKNAAIQVALAESMRERAAQAAEHGWCPGLAAEIRALPTEVPDGE